MFARSLASLCVAAILMAPAAIAANFPGWTRTYQPDHVLFVSPQDANGVVQFVMQKAEHEPGNAQVEFKKAINQIVTGMGGDLTLAKRSGMKVEGGLMFEVLTTKMQGVDIDFLIFAYDTGAKIYQTGLLAYVSAIPETDRRVNHALDFIATATRNKFRLTNPRTFDGAAPSAQQVTTYTTTTNGPPGPVPLPPPPPAAPVQKQAGKTCERRAIWGFRISYWCQPSGICNDRVIKGYETVCE